MSSLATDNALRKIAATEFAALVVSAEAPSLPTGDPLKLRLDLHGDVGEQRLGIGKLGEVYPGSLICAAASLSVKL